MNNTLLIPVNTDEFQKNINIRFKNILSGFDSFLNFTIDAQNLADGEDIIIDFIEKIFEENNDECYVDLYLNTLSEDDKNNLLNLLSDDDKHILKQLINLNHDNPYYKFNDKSLIPFLARLNTREIFFVTFYFRKVPITIWGNYNLNFPCFFNDESNLNHYLKLAEEINLKIKYN